MSAVESDFVECTTEGRTKRHWSLVPTAVFPLNPLCNSTPWAMDQHTVDMRMPPRWRKRKVIAEMPACKQCDKSKARRIAREVVVILIPILVANVIAVLFVAWSLGAALIRIEDYRAEQLPPVVPVEEPLPVRTAPDIERRIDWILPDHDEFEAHLAALNDEYAATIRAFRWATGELERIHVDLRDGALV